MGALLQRTAAAALVACAGLAPAAAGAGESTASDEARAPADRIWSRSYWTWIYSRPIRTKRRLGYVRPGESVKLRSRERVQGQGCAGGFVAVEPHGYICPDRSTSFDPNERSVRARRMTASQPGLMPFEYALSNGTPMYRRVPTRAEWTKEERFLGKPGTHKPLSWGNRGHERLAEARTIPATDSLPFFLQGGASINRSKALGLVRRQIPLGSMLSYTSTFEANGRTWLLSADGTVVPADRVRPFRTSSFQGVELKGAVKLPLAWLRDGPKPKYVRRGDAFEKTEAAWAVRSHVALASDEPTKSGGKGYLETKERDASGRQLWIAEADATIARAVDKLPWGVGENDKWLRVSITGGTLVAYVGLEPKYATLASPGVGGVPIRGRDPVKMSTTPMGIYRVTYKHRASTMSPETGENRSFWIADVPYTQYFNAPFALHTAYWHEDFGKGMSAGCINLSPRDGKWLFDYTDPPLPEGWNGVHAGLGPSAKGTWVVVRR